MAWIESHTVLLRHRKLIAFAKALRLKPVYCLGHLHALWHVALEQAEDGDLSSWTDDFIAESSAFQGDAPRFVSLLQLHGWLDGKILHDWLDYAGLYLTKKYSSSNRDLLVSIWGKHGRIYGERIVNKKRTESEPTLPDLTEPKETPSPPDKPPAVPPPKPPPKQRPKPPQPNGDGAILRPLTDVQRVVHGFKAVLGVSDDDVGWDKVYFPRYTKSAKDLLTLFEGNLDRVADCIDQVSAAMERKKLSWTPETLVKHAGDWKNGRLFK